MGVEGKKVLVTGATRGLGREIALTLAREGAILYLTGRDSKALEEIRRECASVGKDAFAGTCDLSEPDRPEDMVKDAVGALKGLDGLVLNAGTLGPNAEIEDADIEDWEWAIRTNLLGPVRVVRAAIPALVESKGKIVFISGGGATSPMPGVSAYAASKAGLIRFQETIAEELKGRGVEVNAVAPGPLKTKMMDELLAKGSKTIGEKTHSMLTEKMKQGGTPLEKGAKLTAFFLSEASRGITGKLVSAVWDPWEGLADHKDDLARSDAYTLRRITPKDRGLSWG